jgi:hypothetical protein
MAAESMALPDLRSLWSDDADAVYGVALHVVELLNRDPACGERMLAVLREPPSDDGWSVESLDNVMLLLEELAERHRAAALLLMICLHGPAAECTGADEVSDAIGLWVAEADEPAVERFVATHRQFVEQVAHLRDLD